MRWSVKLGEFSGIAVYIHTTFLILIAWVGFSRWEPERSLTAAIAGILFVSALFLCVLLHEFGHALTAKRFGINTENITLLPIGGVARLERMPEDPKQEFLIALAGPAVNVVIALILMVYLAATGRLFPLTELSATSGSFAERLMVINVVLVIFNMIPAFPMDGGRVLRAGLALRMNYARATNIAATLGQGFAFLFGLIGLLGNPFLIFIAFFVWIGAAQEAAGVQLRSALGAKSTADAMITDFRTLTPGDPLSRAVELLLAGSQEDFPVVDNNAVVGILTKVDLLQALARDGERPLVGDVMQRNFESAQEGESLKFVLERLQNRECRTLPVLQQNHLVGLITMENLSEFVSIQSALKAARSQNGNRVIQS